MRLRLLLHGEDVLVQDVVVQHRAREIVHENLYVRRAELARARFVGAVREQPSPQGGLGHKAQRLNISFKAIPHFDDCIP